MDRKAAFTIIPGGLSDKPKFYDAEKEKMRMQLQILKEELESANLARVSLMKENEELRAENEQLKIKRKRRTKSEMEQEVVPYSEYKTNGIKKAKAADPIRSYSDFKQIQDYFLQNGNIRDWAIWTVGVSLGLRISDLISLKVEDLFDEQMEFRERIFVIEKKTSKLNNCLITESVKISVKKYLSELGQVTRGEFLFRSRKTKGLKPMAEEYVWRLFSDAGKSLALPINIGSHTMRKSFANIAACVDKSSIDMNAITKIQGLLNHSDQKVTMRYLGTYQDMFDRARIAVSDFVLGKTDVQELVAGNNYTIDDVMSKLEDILEKGD